MSVAAEREKTQGSMGGPPGSVPIELQNNIGQLAENLCGLQSVAKTQLTLTRAEAGYYIWRHAVISDAKRQEIARMGCVNWLLQLLTGGDSYSKHVSVGCLQYIALCEDLRDLIVGKGTGDKNLNSIVKLLEGDHDRTKSRAAALLYQVCQLPDIAFKLKDYVKPLLEVLDDTVHTWAGVEQTRACVAGCLRALAATDFSPETISFRQEPINLRAAMVAEGALPPLVRAMKTGIPQGQTEAVATLALLAEEDGVAETLLELGALPKLVEIAATGSDEGRAHAAGCLMLIAVEPSHMQRVHEAGAIAPLVALLTPPRQEEAEGKKKSKKKKKAPPLPPAIDLAIQNAAGAVRHLSFYDPCVREIVESGAVAALVGLLDSRNILTFQHATGCLYNFAMDPAYYDILIAAKAPKYLARPLHPRWLVQSKTDEDKDEDEAEGPPRPGSSVALDPGATSMASMPTPS